MMLRDVSLAVLLLTFAFSLVTFIASVKYVEWAAASPQRAQSLAPLIFYASFIPLLSLIQTALQLLCVHIFTSISLLFVLTIAALGSAAWIAQASIWTACELSGGALHTVKHANIPQWCPQRPFEGPSRSVSVALTIFKDIMAWVIFSVYVATVVLIILQMRQKTMGHHMAEFHELVDVDPSPTVTAKPFPHPMNAESGPRPYSSTFFRPEPQPRPSSKTMLLPGQPQPMITAR